MKDGPERVVTYHGGHRGTFPERITMIFYDLLPAFTKPELSAEHRTGAAPVPALPEVKLDIGCRCWRFAPISVFNNLLRTNSGHLSKASNQANQGTQ
jgi:hypothetical protein